MLVAELLERRTLSVREAVLSSGRHEQDVVACLLPLVRSGALARNEDGFAIASGAPEPLLQALRDGVEKRRDRLERDRFVRSRVLRGMIGVDPKMQLVFEAIRQVCRLDVPVLIIGETGTGKELVARALHELGPRRAANFEAVNCATLPTSLFESHMFGHARGAFTGADQEHDGIFERCNDGTVLLDELGELEVANQAKLLRVLQERRVQRLGGSRATPIRARILATTHRDLEAAVDEGSFRLDLYYRLKVVHLELPPLRERRGDVPLLVEHYLQRFAVSSGKPRLRVDPAVMQRFEAYSWPGNVRELANLVEAEASLAAPEVEILSSVPTSLLRRLERGTSAPPRELLPDASGPIVSLAELERRAYAHALAHCDGNIAEAAKALGVSRATFYNKLHRYGLERR